MNSVQKIAATATAVAAIACGTYLATTNTSSNDGSVYTPTIPVAEIAVAEIYVPTISKADISLAEIPTANIQYVSYDNKPIDIYEDNTPAWNIRTEVIDVVSVNTADVNAIKVTGADIHTTAIETASVATPTVNGIAVSQAEVSTANPLIRATQDFFNSFTKFFKDRAQVFNDPSINRHNTKVQEWLAIAKDYETYTQSFIPMPTNLKVIAEVHHPIDADTLMYNLDMYSKKGYNAVLITFGYDNEDVYVLRDVAEIVKARDMSVLIAYAGPETHKHSVLDSPTIINNKLRVLAPVADGLVLGWRRTSLHLYKQDTVFTNFIIKNARTYNEKLYTIGETFYGELTTDALEIKTGLAYNIPTNSSGVLISGLGIGRIAVERVLTGLLANISTYNKTVLIVGERPYYNTRNLNGWSFEKNQEYKEALVKRWNKAGVSNTIVLHGDGSDGTTDPEKTDNIAYTKY